MKNKHQINTQKIAKLFSYVLHRFQHLFQSYQLESRSYYLDHFNVVILQKTGLEKFTSKRPIGYAKKKRTRKIKLNVQFQLRNNQKQQFLFSVTQITLAAFIFIVISSKAFPMSLLQCECCLNVQHKMRLKEYFSQFRRIGLKVFRRIF